MSSIELELYELLKLKIGERETKALFDLVEHKIDAKKDELATKLDIEKLRAELLVIKWMLGVVLAGIVSLVVKSFFA
jgi:predicted transcriptional regulator